MNREDFHAIKGRTYLDSGATTQKPDRVIERIIEYYREENANIHRGVYELAQKATLAYEGARERMARFINCSPEEIVFTRGTTESINLAAFSFVEPLLKEGDEILISLMEHHANIVPWQLLCERTGARLKVIPLSEGGDLLMDRFRNLLSERTRILAVTHISNVLGTVNPVADLVAEAGRAGVPVLIDGAQAIARTAVDVKALGADFYVFSGHKMYGPTGIGVLYGKKERLESMRPYQSGGDMIRSVSFEKTTWNDIPHKFEAGTPHIAGAVGLAAAADYLEGLGLHNIEKHEKDLLAYGENKLSGIGGLRIIGSPLNRAAVLSFTLDGTHPHDIAHELSVKGISVRAGHHCAQPLMNHYGLPATTRLSLGLYNERGDIDRLAEALPPIREKFRL